MFLRLCLTLLVFTPAPAAAVDPPAPGTIRVATYNVALYGERRGELAARLAPGDDAQARALAEVIQRVRPDVLLLCEIDYEDDGAALDHFVRRYLAEPQAGLGTIAYPHRFTAPVNTGVPTGLDLNGDGDSGDPDDCYGYGRYPGQYGMAVLSRFPIDEESSRTFRNLRWSDLPDARRPKQPSGDDYYPDAVWRQLRLPSKSFWDVAVDTPGPGTLRLLCSHPTPPVFDGPEDRNGCRNADEVRLVREYVTGGLADYFVDDRGKPGPLRSDDSFVVLGDLNADPLDGDGRRDAIRRLLECEPLAADPAPESAGGRAACERNAELNLTVRGDPGRHTGDFSVDGHANLRIDYALPSRNVETVAAGVFWPAPGEPGAEAASASDHRLVWVDVRLSSPPETDR